MKLEKGKGLRTKTLGELALENQKQETTHIAVNDLGHEILQKDEVYMRKLWKCINNGLEVFGIPVVYVEVHKWIDRAIQQVGNIRMKPRVSCATPTYGQDVWKYDVRDGHLQVLWSMPDRESSIAYVQNPKMVPKNEQQTLFTVLDFYNGSLDMLCQQEIAQLDELLLKLDGSVIIH
jgi:hypothetical protein